MNSPDISPSTRSTTAARQRDVILPARLNLGLLIGMLVITAIFAWVIMRLASGGHAVVGAVLFILLVIGLAAPMWILFGSSYAFTATDLQVRSGPFRWRVPFDTITGQKLDGPDVLLTYGQRGELRLKPKNAAALSRQISQSCPHLSPTEQS